MRVISARNRLWNVWNVAPFRAWGGTYREPHPSSCCSGDDGITRKDEVRRQDFIKVHPAGPTHPIQQLNLRFPQTPGRATNVLMRGSGWLHSRHPDPQSALRKEDGPPLTPDTAGSLPFPGGTWPSTLAHPACMGPCLNPPDVDPSHLINRTGVRLVEASHFMSRFHYIQTTLTHGEGTTARAPFLHLLWKSRPGLLPFFPPFPKLGSARQRLSRISVQS